MTKPFDVTMKQLVQRQPAAWLQYVGLPNTGAELLDADLSTLTTDADKVLKCSTVPPSLVHLEFQAGYERNMGKRMLRYNVLLDYRHDLTVQSVVILLRREADGPEMTGRVERQHISGQRYLGFEYAVVRVWERPMEAALAGGLATLPLAALADVSLDQLPDVIHRMEERIRQEASPSEARELWTETFVLMGLKYSNDRIRSLLKGVVQMRESTTYMAILEEGMAEGKAKGLAEGKAEGLMEGKAEGLMEGKVEEARSLILRLGSKRFGAPDAATRAILEAITSVERLELLAERLLEAESWAELLS